MHLHLDVRRSAREARDRLLTACAAEGLRVAATHAPPPGPSGRACYVIELVDPLPGVPTDDDEGASSGRRDVYPITVFDTEPGWCKVATLRPAAFVDLLGHPELAGAAEAFERTLHAVLAALQGSSPDADAPTARSGRDT